MTTCPGLIYESTLTTQVSGCGLLRNMSRLTLWNLSRERAHRVLVNAASCAITRASLVKLSETGRRRIKLTQVSLSLPPGIEHVGRVAGFKGLGRRHTGECARNARNAREIARARGRSGACVNSSAVSEGFTGGEEEDEEEKLSDHDLSLHEKLHNRNSFCFPGKFQLVFPHRLLMIILVFAMGRAELIDIDL